MENLILGYMVYIRKKGFFRKLVVQNGMLVPFCTTIEQATMFVEKDDFASSCAATSRMLGMTVEQDMDIVPIPVTEEMASWIERLYGTDLE